MSTIDKASLIQIPSGYKNGKLYSIKPTPTYGSEEITNGDFSSNSDWTLTSSANITNGKLNVSAGAFDFFAIQTALVNGNFYKISIEVTVTSGSVLLYTGGQFATITSSGVYNYNFTSDSTQIRFRSSGSGFVGSIDNVSVKEITNIGDFDFERSSSATRVNSEGLIEVAKVLGTTEEVTNGDFATNSDWSGSASISGGQLTKTSGGLAYQGGVVTANKYYKVIVDVASLDGATQLYFGGNQYTLSVGVQTIEAVGGTSNTFVGFNNGYSSGTGSVFNSISVIQYIENDVPRLDYSGGASCASLLLEGQSTNEITYSEIFTESGYDWNYSADALEVAESNSIISPDGTQNADKIAKTAVRVYAYAYKTATMVSAQKYSWSMFMKKGTHDIGLLSLTQADTEYKAYYDLTNGTSGMLSGSATHKIEDYGNGWYKCSLQDISSTTDLYVRFNFGMAYSTSNEHWPSSSEGEGLYAYFWGAQLEQGNLTSYIPTSGSTVTRTADVCNNAGTSATFNSTEGVLFVEMAALADDTQQQIGVYGDSTTEQLRIEITNNVIKGQLYNGAFQANMSSTQTVTNFNKVALKWKVDDFALWINGTEVATDSSGTTFSAETLDRVHFSAQNGSTYAAQAKTKQLMTFNEALSDEELSDLTGQVNLSFNNLATFYNYTIL